MNKPELDYAFLADFATILDGKLTAVGASYTQVCISEFPIVQDLYVAGRIRKPEGHGEVLIELKLTPPSESGMEMNLDGVLSPHPEEVAYDGKVGTFFVIHTPLPLESPGLYVVNLEIDGTPVRRLAFEASLIPAT